jgi:putative ABC transport system permease protein
MANSELDARGRGESLDTLRRELRHAARTLARSPSFTLVAFVTLALGLGAATTIFTLLDRVVLQPLPYPEARRLVHIGTLWPGVKADAEFAISRGQFFYFRQQSRTLVEVGLYDGDAIAIPGDGVHPAERVPAIEASASLFRVLGIVPERGRLFREEEGVPRVRSVALISHGYWERRYGADPAILGKRIVVGPEESYEIIGVLRPGADVPDMHADIWIPNWLDPNQPPQNNHTHRAIALARPGVSIEAVRADIQRMQADFAALYPRVYPPQFIERTGFAMHTIWLRDHIVGDSLVRALWVLFGAVGFVLLIAAANVVNLFLVRIDARGREMAVRRALGADRSHLAAHYLGESLLLAGVSALGAIVLAAGLLRVVLMLAPGDLPRLAEVSLGSSSVVFCVVVALAFGIAFGVLPIVGGGRTGDATVLREGGRGMTTSRRRNSARQALVASQVALAVLLLSGAVLMAKSFLHLQRVRPGFDATGVETMTIALPYARYGGWQKSTAFWHELSRRVEALPGVVRAGGTGLLPLTGDPGCTSVVTDVARNTTSRGGCVPFVDVTPGYFETLGIRVAGESPTWSSVEGQEGPVVVSRAFADRYWPGEDPIGHGIRPFNSNMPEFRVVGVAEDVRGNGLQRPPVEAVYFPIAPAKGMQQWNGSYGLTFVVKTSTARPSEVVPAVRRILEELDSQVPISDVQSMENVLARSMAQTSFTMTLLLISAFIALALSAVGIYGVISYVVAQRRAEIGVRMALGAEVGRIAGMVVRQSVGVALVGVALGLVATVIGTRLLRALLFEVSPTDPVALALTTVVLVAVAALASALPARRAARVDPVEALRA